jgi:hypothetical protein
MAKNMVTLRLDPAEANLAAVSRKLHLSNDEIDPHFGVVCISPGENLYTILVEESASKKLQGNEEMKGPYSNPKIEPFGPPKS